MTTKLAPGDRVYINPKLSSGYACPTHQDPAIPAYILPETTPCWCVGQVKRVFFDGSVLVAGKHGFVRVFQEADISLWYH